MYHLIVFIPVPSLLLLILFNSILNVYMLNNNIPSTSLLLLLLFTLFLIITKILLLIFFLSNTIFIMLRLCFYQINVVNACFISNSILLPNIFCCVIMLTIIYFNIYHYIIQSSIYSFNHKMSKIMSVVVVPIFIPNSINDNLDICSLTLRHPVY